MDTELNQIKVNINKTLTMTVKVRRHLASWKEQ